MYKTKNAKDRFKYSKVEIKTDCVAYMKEGICSMDDKPYRQPCDGLNTLVCEKSLCSFYKPKKN